jgi:FkbM family methyltransferase
MLYFEHMYPAACIIEPEPDPAIFPYLEENVSRNILKDGQLVEAALSAREGTVNFYLDGKYGSCLAECLSTDIPEG